MLGKYAFMDVYQAIVDKRDTRDFTAQPVSDSDMHKLLQAARMAGSAKNSQLNRIVVVTDADDRTKLAECGTFAEWVVRAPVVFVIVVPASAPRLFDVGRMGQNMLVTAHSLGLASCPVTFHHQECVRRLLGVPDDFEAPMGVGVGHPAPPPQERQSSPRIPLDALVRLGSLADLTTPRAGGVRFHPTGTSHFSMNSSGRMMARSSLKRRSRPAAASPPSCQRRTTRPLGRSTSTISAGGQVAGPVHALNTKFPRNDRTLSQRERVECRDSTR